MKWSVLHQPYPFDSSYRRALITAFAFGLFVGLFLIVFQPFGINNYRANNKVFKILGYGLVTVVVLFGNYSFFRLVFPKWFRKSSWTVLKNLLYTIWMFLCIGTANLLYSYFQGFVNLTIYGFLRFQLLTILVGILPVTLSTFIIYYRRLKKMMSAANRLNSSMIQEASISQDLINIPSLNKSEGLQLNVQHLLAIKAEENYIEVLYLKDQLLQKELIRNTLKNIEESLASYEFIKKCHRSYLVNLQNVNRFDGNAQGLSLFFHLEANLQIPVSRSFVKSIKEQLKKNGS